MYRLLSLLTASALAASAVAAKDDPTLSLADSETYGQHITTSEGKPVYMFTTDTQVNGGNPKISCTTEGCLAAWPLVTIDGEATVGTGLKEALVDTFDHEGRTVVTYNGWPLYTFAQDQAGQEPQGQDVQSFGGEWYLIDAEGEKVQEEGHG